MSLLRKAAEFLNRHNSIIAEKIIYSRNGVNYRLSAATGATMFKVNDEYGAAVYWRGQDFIVSAADMPFNPKRGDVITLGEQKFEVLAPTDEPCFRYCDPQGIRMRIHSKRIDS